MKIAKSSSGEVELHISDNPDLFDNIANKIIEITNATVIEKIDSLDQSYWDIKIDGEAFTIHREHYLGIKLFSSSELGEEVLNIVKNSLSI